MGRSFWYGLAGLILGVALGLVYTWLIAPVEFYDTAPARLRADLKDDYILMISEAYAADGDWTAAKERLADLDDPEIPATVLTMAEQAIAQGRSVSAIRYLATMAERLGATSQAVVLFLPTRAVPSPSPAALATFTLTPPPMPTVTLTPSTTPTSAPTATTQPTRTPRPSPTPQLNYRLVAQQRICDATWPEPRIQVVVRDADGDGVGGVEVVVSWGTGEDRLYTGFKPELGRGYADLEIVEGVSYSVQLAGGSDQASGIQATSCNSSAGPRSLSTRLVFEALNP